MNRWLYKLDIGKMKTIKYRQNITYDSKFLKRANSDTICDALLHTLNSFDEEKMLMLSIDKLGQHREDNEIPVSFDIGSCSLHVVHSGFQVGVETTKWNLGKVFQAIWKILHNSSARRDIYKTAIRTDLLTLPFYETLWVQD